VKNVLLGLLALVAVALYAFLPSVVSDKRFRWCATALFAGLAMFNLSLVQRSANANFRAGTAPRFAAEAQRQELRHALPAKGRVGYISDKMPWRSDDDGVVRYFLTQYDVAPVVVDVGAEDHEWVIGNFEKFDPHSVPSDLTVAGDFGNGVMLFRKRAN
jgi:hypothetical protein